MVIVLTDLEDAILLFPPPGNVFTLRVFEWQVTTQKLASKGLLLEVMQDIFIVFSLL